MQTRTFGKTGLKVSVLGFGSLIQAVAAAIASSSITAIVLFAVGESILVIEQNTQASMNAQQAMIRILLQTLKG